MANEAYVAKKVAEVAKNPKALLLGAIGAMRSTPTNSAKVAENELGLSKEEIQGARWVALFKKGKTDLEFLKGLLEIITQKEAKMIKIEFFQADSFKKVKSKINKWLEGKPNVKIVSSCQSECFTESGPIDSDNQRVTIAIFYED